MILSSLIQFVQVLQDYVSALMLQQLGVGVKFAAELLVMGMRMTLESKRDENAEGTPRNAAEDFIIVTVDLKNAFNAIWRAAIRPAETHVPSRPT